MHHDRANRNSRKRASIVLSSIDDPFSEGHTTDYLELEEHMIALQNMQINEKGNGLMIARFPMKGK